MTLLQGAIAANRFGLGARPGEIQTASSDPRGWLKAQIRSDAAIISGEGLMSVEQVFEERRDAYADMAAAGGGLRPGATKRTAAGDPANTQKPGAGATPAQQEVRKMIQRESRDGLQKEIEARSRFAASTQSPFAERWVRFWSNHFTVAARNAQLIGIVGPFERDVIRPNAFGSFAGLLGHATFHPTMLIYLDANRSIGPSTIAAQRRKAGLNENLAREVLELHTVGVGSGYTQADVIEFAKALTGWTVGGPGGGGGFAKAAQAGSLARNFPRRRLNDGLGGGGLQPIAMRLNANPGQTVFMEQLHEPGVRTVLGKAYRAEGKQQAAAILDDLARNPATAKHIATKLARHFVSDDPPPALVERCAGTFSKSDGDIRETLRCIVTSPEFFSRAAYRAKVKTPFEVVASGLRALNARPDTTPRTAQIVARLGQPIFGRQTPDGWPDRGDAWMNTGAILNRINFGLSLAGGQVPGARLASWPQYETVRTLPRAQQVDSVVKSGS